MNLCTFCQRCDKKLAGDDDPCIDGHHVNLFFEVEEGSYVLYCIHFRATNEARVIAIDG